MWHWVKVTHSCPTLCDPVDCTVHGILQGRTLEWVAFPSSRGSFQPRDRTQVSCIAGGFFTCWAISSGQFSCSAVSNSLRPHGLQHAKPHQLLQFNQTHGHWVCDATQPSHPLSSSSPPGFSLSSIKVFSTESVLHIRWPKDWNSHFTISPFNEYWGLISLRMDCLELLAVQGTLKSLLQHHSSKASILRCSAFFIVNTWLLEKNIALARQTFVGTWEV